MKLVGSKSYFNATEAICITTSKFTKQAKEIASNSGVHLVDRYILLGLCREKNVTIPILTHLVDEKKSHFETRNIITRIGKFQDNEIVIDDPYISKHHATLMRYKLHFSIEDNASTNGTFVNESKISSKTALNYGDRIKIYKHVFVVAMCTPSGTYW
jgi:hypothetical protein